MAAKLLRTMSDENSDMPKHVGCMAGIFHLFGRGHFLSRRHVSRQGNKTVRPAGSVSLVPTDSHKPDGKSIVKDSIFYREVRGISVKASNKKESARLTYIDSPRPSLPPPKPTKSKLYGFRESLPVDSRFPPRFSYDGRESKPSMKMKELPRYSLDSKRPTSPLSEEHGSHRRQPSIVAKLMGLEDLEETEVSEYDPIEKSSEEEEEKKKKKSTAPSRRLELAPWTRPEVTTVYGQIEKRLSHLEFQKSGKDLRALKQILQAMQSGESNKERKSTSPKNTECEKKPTLLPGLKKLELGESKRREMKKTKQNRPSPDSRSPRQPKTKTSTRLDSPQRIDPSRKTKSKSKVTGSDHLTEQSNSTSMQSDSINSQEEDLEVSSAYRQERKKMVARIREEDLIGKSHTPEQPSPVSVLDAITYEDEPPSPVRMRKNDVKATEPLSYNKARQMTEPKFASTRNQHDPCSEILFLRPMKPIQRSKEIKPTSQNNAVKSKYIDELQKRLVSDVVNELLIEKLASNRSIPSVKQRQQLLKKLCSEIDELPCKLDEEDTDCFRKMLVKDFDRRSEDWKLGFSENAGIVLDIERMIFRDLICEVVSSEEIEFRVRYMRSRRKLFQN